MAIVLRFPSFCSDVKVKYLCATFFVFWMHLFKEKQRKSDNLHACKQIIEIQHFFFFKKWLYLFKQKKSKITFWYTIFITYGTFKVKDEACQKFNCIWGISLMVAFWKIWNAWCIFFHFPVAEKHLYFS